MQIVRLQPCLFLVLRPCRTSPVVAYEKYSKAKSFARNTCPALIKVLDFD